jgi:hypothetical protein
MINAQLMVIERIISAQIHYFTRLKDTGMLEVSWFTILVLATMNRVINGGTCGHTSTSWNHAGINL